MEALLSNFGNIEWQMLVMWAIGGILIYLAIAKEMEPTLLLPMGFGAILMNLPAETVAIVESTGMKYYGEEALQMIENGTAERAFEGVQGVISGLFSIGIDFHELFPLLLFVGIGAMIDFGPVLSNPKLMIFGAAAQFGIFFTLFMATLFGFELRDAASIAIIGAADGPTAIFVAKQLASNYIAPIMVAAYSYMALVPLVQPPIIKLCTSKKERRIKMAYEGKNVSKRTKILFPIVVTVIVALVAPDAVALIGFLMFGNLIRECGVLNSLSDTAQNVLANLITLFLGVTIAARMHYTEFLKYQTLLIMCLGLVAFIVDTFGGIMIAKIMNIFLPEGKKINPMIGAAGISAFPMSARVVHKLGLEEDNQNFLLMHSIGVNVSGQVASVIAGGLILALVAPLVG